MQSEATVFGVALAAFCVWLFVRIMNRRERWAITLAILLALAVAALAPFAVLVWEGRNC
jgi:hypothetical protein